MRSITIAVSAIAFCGAVAVALADEKPIQLKKAAGADKVEANCAACHTLDYIPMNSPFLNAAGWDAEVTKMINAFGARSVPTMQRSSAITSRRITGSNAARRTAGPIPGTAQPLIGATLVVAPLLFRRVGWAKAHHMALGRARPLMRLCPRRPTSHAGNDRPRGQSRANAVLMSTAAAGDFAHPTALSSSNVKCTAAEPAVRWPLSQLVQRARPAAPLCCCWACMNC